MYDLNMRLRQQVGETLRAERVARGLSQADLAKLAGVTPGYISHIETGYANGTLQKVDDIFEALGVVPVLQADKNPDPFLVELASVVAVIPDDAKGMVIGMVRGFLAAREQNAG